MTIEDFSNTFDILYNNLMSNRAPEVNDYEKSMLLTMAQEDIVKELYNKAFEGNEQARRALDALLVEAQVDPDEDVKSIEVVTKHVQTTFDLPDDVWYIVRETVHVADEGKCADGRYIPVKPERLDDLSYDLGNPFRGPAMGRALRVDRGGDRKTRRVEVFSKDKIDKYVVTYVRRPAPILLADFSDPDVYDNIHIRGVQNFQAEVGNKGYAVADLTASPCELSETVQQDIITKAVMYAKAAFAS